MSSEETNAIPPEYVHDLVHKIASEFVEHKITFEPINNKIKDPEQVKKIYSQFGHEVKKYFNPKITGIERKELEAKLFEKIIAFSLVDAFKDRNNSSSTVDKQVEKLTKRLDSTDKLLMSIFKILQKISEKIDKL